MDRAIIVFTRVPLPGKTKTRMMPALSGKECARLHTYFLQDIWPMKLLVTAAVICLLYLFRRFVLSKLRMNQRWVSIGLCVIFILAGTALILSTQMYPISDSAKILRIVCWNFPWIFTMQMVICEL